MSAEVAEVAQVAQEAVASSPVALTSPKASLKEQQQQQQEQEPAIASALQESAPTENGKHEASDSAPAEQPAEQAAAEEEAAAEQEAAETPAAANGKDAVPNGGGVVVHADAASSDAASPSPASVPPPAAAPTTVETTTTPASPGVGAQLTSPKTSLPSPQADSSKSQEDIPAGMSPAFASGAARTPSKEVERVSPSISVKELTRQLSSTPAPVTASKPKALATPPASDAPSEAKSPSPFTSPPAAPSSTKPPVAPGSAVALPQITSPRPTGQALRSQRSTKEQAVGVVSPPAEARSAHDQRNTINAAQLLKLGAFKLQPLKDFVAYEELIKLRLEDGIDPTRKEDYLGDDEFEKVMGVTRDGFVKLPAWRKVDLKKKKLLF